MTSTPLRQLNPSVEIFLFGLLVNIVLFCTDEMMILEQGEVGEASSPLISLSASDPEGLPTPQSQLSQSLFDFDYGDDYNDKEGSASGCFLYNEGKLSI